MIAAQKKYAWITLNRACNLKCYWCYCKDTNKDNVSIDKALLIQLIDFCYSANVSKIIFLGGEPTLYPFLPDALAYSKALGMETEITTNGLRLADEDYLKHLIKSGLYSVMLSFKGATPSNYYSVTSFDGYNLALKALENLAAQNIKYGSSFVLTDDSIKCVENMMSDLLRIKTPLLVFSFAKDYGKDYESEMFRRRNSPYTLLPQLYEKYRQNIEIFTELKWCLELCFPLRFDRKEYDSFLSDRAHFSCKANKFGELVFDMSGNLLMCNTMPDAIIGTFGQDFRNFTEYQAFIKNIEGS